MVLAKFSCRCLRPSTLDGALLLRVANRFGRVCCSIAFVNYSTEAEADRAIAEMHGSVFEGRTLVAQYAFRSQDQGDPSKFQMNPPTKTLFIGNMSFSMSDKDLNDLFLEVENCTDVRIAMDRRTGLPRGFAHADFTDVKSAQKAREFLNDRELLGRKLRIDYSRRQEGQRPREGEQARAKAPAIDPDAQAEAAQ